MRRAEIVLLASGIALAGGCGLVLGYDDYAPASGGTGGATATSTGTATTASGAGGSGGGPTSTTTTGTDTGSTTGTTTTTGSTSSTGTGMCECPDCEACALGANGPCSSAYGDCLTSGECLSLDNCVKACPAPDNVTWLECANGCFLAANNAVRPQYHDLLACVCTTCTDCGDVRCDALHCLNGAQDMAENGVDCSNGIMQGDTCLICTGFACAVANPEACKSGACNAGICQ